MSQLSRAGFNEFEVKLCIGKSIPISDGTYLRMLKDSVAEKYPKVYDAFLNIDPPTIKTEVKTEDFKRLELQVENLTTQLAEAKKERAKSTIQDALIADLIKTMQLKQKADLVTNE